MKNNKQNISFFMAALHRKADARIRLENAQLAYDQAAAAYKANGSKNTPEEVAKFKKLDEELSEAMSAYAKFFTRN